MARKQGSIKSFTYRILNAPVRPVCGEHIDTTLGATEESRLKKQYGRQIKALARETYFTYNELEALLLIYIHFAKAARKKYMQKSQLKMIFHIALDLTDSDFNEIISEVWDNTKGAITFENWVRGLSLCLRGKLEERIRFVFRCYDVFNYGRLTRDNLMQLCGTFIIGEGDDGLRDYVDLMIKRLDQNRDGKIDLDDFTKSVMQEPNLLECFGQCLPQRRAITAFLSTFSAWAGKHFSGTT